MHYPIQLLETDREIVLTQLQNVITAANGSWEEWAYNRNTSITQRNVKNITVSKELYRNQYRFYESDDGNFNTIYKSFGNDYKNRNYINNNSSSKVNDNAKSVINNTSVQSASVVDSVHRKTPENEKMVNSQSKNDVHTKNNNNNESNDANTFCYTGSNKLKFVSNQVNTGFLGNDGRKYNSCGRTIPLLTQLYKLQDQLRECSDVHKVTFGDSTVAHDANKQHTNESVDYLISEYDILSVFCAACHEDEMYGTVNSVALNALITFVNEPCAFLTAAGLQLCVWTAMTCKSEIADIASHEIFVSRVMNLFTSIVSHELCSTHTELLSEALYVNILRRMLAVILWPNLSLLLRHTAERSMHIVIRTLLERVKELQNKRETAELYKVMTGAHIIRLASALILGDIKAANDDARICVRPCKMEISQEMSEEHWLELHHTKQENNIDVQWPSESITCEDIVAAQIEGLSMAQHIVLTMQKLFPFNTLSSELVYCIQNNLCRSLLMSAVALRNTSEHYLLSQVLRTMHVVIGYARNALVPQIYAFLQTIHVQPLIHITQTLALHEAYQNNRDDVEDVVGPITNMAVQLPFVEWDNSNNNKNNRYDVNNMSKSFTNNIPSTPDGRNINNVNAKTKGVSFSTEVNQLEKSENKEDQDVADVQLNEFVISSDYTVPLNTCAEPCSPLICSSPTYVYSSSSSKNIVKCPRGYDVRSGGRNDNHSVKNNKDINYYNYKQQGNNFNNTLSNINMSNYTFTHKTSSQLQHMREEREVLLESLANLCSDVTFLEWCYTQYDLSWRYSSILPQLWSLLSAIAFDNKVVLSTVINGVTNVNNEFQLSLLLSQIEEQEGKLSTMQQCEVDINKSDHNTDNNNNDNDVTVSMKCDSESSAIPLQVTKMFENTKSKWPHGAQIILYSSRTDADNGYFDNSTYTVETNNISSKSSDVKSNNYNAQRGMFAERSAIGSSSYTNDHIGQNTNAIEYNCHLVGKEKLSQVQIMALSILACLQTNIHKVIHYSSLHTPLLTTTTAVSSGAANNEPMINTDSTEQSCIVETIEQMKQQKEELAEFAARFHQSAEDNGVPFLLRYARRVHCLPQESERDVLEKNANEYKSQLVLLEPAGAREIGACLFRLSGVLNKRILGEYIGELGKEDNTKEDKAKSSNEQIDTIKDNTDNKYTNTNLPSYGSKLFHQLLLLGFMQQFRFAGKPLLTAIRELVYKVCLPGESQKIDRVMEAAAQQWYAANQNKSKEINPFQSEEGAFILSFAIIMLNTDLHSGKLKQCMTKDEFTRMNRGIDAGADVPESYLNLLYDDVKEHEIVMADMTERSFGNDVTWDLQRNTPMHADKESNHFSCFTHNNSIVLHQMLSSDMSTYSLPVYMYMYFVSSQQLADIPARGSNLIVAVEKLAEEMPHMYKTFECALNSLATLVKMASVGNTSTREQIYDLNSELMHMDNTDVDDVDSESNNEMIAHTAFCVLMSGAVMDLTRIDRTVNLMYESLPCVLTVRVMLQLIPYLSTRYYYTWKLLAKLISSLYVQGVLTLSANDTFIVNNNEHSTAKLPSNLTTSESTVFNNYWSLVVNPRLSRLTIPLINEKASTEDDSNKRQQQKELINGKSAIKVNNTNNNVNTDIKSNNSTPNRTQADTPHNAGQETNLVHVESNNVSNVNNNNNNSGGGGGNWLTTLWSNVTAAAAAAASEGQRRQEILLCNAQRRTEQALLDVHELIGLLASTQLTREAQTLFICALCEETQMKAKKSVEAIQSSYKLSLLCAIVCELIHQFTFDEDNNSNWHESNMKTLQEHTTTKITSTNVDTTRSNTNFQRNTMMLMIMEQLHKVINHNCTMVFDVLQTPREHSPEAAQSRVIISTDAYRRWSQVAVRLIQSTLTLTRALTHIMEQSHTLNFIQKELDMLLSYARLPLLSHILLPSLVSFLYVWINELLSQHENKRCFAKPSDNVHSDGVYNSEKDNDHHESLCIANSRLSNVLISTATELCMCANTSNISFESLSQLQIIMFALTKYVCINDIQCATRVISAAFHIGAIVLSLPRYMEELCLSEKLSRQTAKINQASSNFNEDKTNQVDNCRFKSKNVNVSEIIMQCLENYNYNNSKESETSVQVNSSKSTTYNNYDNSSYLYLLALKAFAKLIIHTCNANANESLLCFQRTLLDVRRMPLTVTVLEKIYEEVLIPLTQYMCVNAALIRSSFTENGEYKLKRKQSLQNEQHHYSEKNKSKRSENDDNNSDNDKNEKDHEERKDNNNTGWGSNTARSMLFSFFQTLAPSPQPAQQTSAHKTEAIKVQRTDTSVVGVNNECNERNVAAAVDDDDNDINANKNVNNKMTTRSEMMKSSNNVEIYGDVELDLTEYNNRIIRNATNTVNKSRNKNNNNIACANVDVKCRVVNLLAKPFLHHFTILLTREPEMLLTLWEQMLITLRLVYLSHDCNNNNGTTEWNTDNTEQVKQKEEITITARSAERAQLESRVVNDEVEANMLVCEAVEEVVKNAIYVVTATLLSSYSSEEERAEATTNELEYNNNDKQALSQSVIKKEFCCLTKQLLSELPFASPLLSYMDALYCENENESKICEINSNTEDCHRDSLNERTTHDDNHQSTRDDVNNCDNQLETSKVINTQSNDNFEEKQYVETRSSLSN